MRFLVSLVLPPIAPAQQRRRAAEILDGLFAVRIAPQLWIVNGEGAAPSAAHELADRMLSVVGPGDSAEVMVIPMPLDAAAFGVSDQVARWIGAV